MAPEPPALKREQASPSSYRQGKEKTFCKRNRTYTQRLFSYQKNEKFAVSTRLRA